MKVPLLAKVAAGYIGHGSSTHHGLFLHRDRRRHRPSRSSPPPSAAAAPAVDTMSRTSSPLSSPPSSDDDLPQAPPHRPSPSVRSTSDLSSAPDSRAMSSPKRKQPREPDPPHEDVLADNPDIAVSCARPRARPTRPRPAADLLSSSSCFVPDSVRLSLPSSPTWALRT